MKKSILTAAVALALGLSSANALAVVNIDTSTGAATYASEVDAENLAALTGAGLNSTVALGFGFSTTNSIAYVRYDIEGGTWSAPIVNTDLVVTDSATAAVAGVALSAGGTTTDNYVVFNITAPTGGLAPASSVAYNLGTAVPAKGIKLSANSSGVTLRYRLYANPVDAATGNANTLKDVSASLVAFAPGLTFTTTTNTSTASVAINPPFTTLVAQTPVMANSTVARLGAVTLGVNTAVLDANGVALSTPATILSATVGTTPGTSINVVGDFGAVDTSVSPSVGAVYLASDATCATPTATGTLAADQQSAAIILPAIAAGTAYVCYSGNGAIGFAEDTYTVSLVPVTNTNYLATKINFTNLALGEIKRDGTELQATFMSNADAQVSRFIFINTGSSAAPLTGVKVLMNDGVTYTPGTLTLPQSIPAGGRLAIQAAQIISGFSTGSNAGVIFSVGATSANIQGTYQYKMNGSDVQTVVQMVRPGTN